MTRRGPVKESDDVQNVRLPGQEETETQEVAEIEGFSPENARPRAFSFPALGALTFPAVAANNEVGRRRTAEPRETFRFVKRCPGP
jgi:hypothetical protein